MSILINTLRAIAYTLVDPNSVLILIMLAFMLYRQNKNITIMQKMIVGENFDSSLELTISQIVIGIIAGAVSSIILAFLGVAFDENSAIYLIFLISIFFMFIKPRFICFAYSGALLGILSLILELISKIYAGVKINLFGSVIDLANVDILKIDIGSLIVLISVLHFIEGILVIIDGKRGAIPVFTNRGDKIIGGFALRRNWLVPVALFLIINNPINLEYTQNIATPSWWPFLKISPFLNMAKGAAVTLFAYFSIIGYSSVTFTKSKEEKTFSSGIALLLYSIILFVLAQFSYLSYMYKLLLIIFTPVAHEFMINIQNFLEVKRNPKYVSGDNGIMVLEVAPNSPAQEMGIKSGDLLVEVNNKKITSENDILYPSIEGVNYISFKIERGMGKHYEVSYNKMNKEKKIGIVFVPKNIPKDSTVIHYDETKFKEIFDKIKNKKDDDE